MLGRPLQGRGENATREESTGHGNSKPCKSKLEQDYGEP